MAAGETKDVICCHAGHSEEGVWRWPHQIRAIWHNRSEDQLNLYLSDDMFWQLPVKDLLVVLSTLGGHLLAGLPAPRVILLRSCPAHISWAGAPEDQNYRGKRSTSFQAYCRYCNTALHVSCFFWNMSYRLVVSYIELITVVVVFSGPG